MFIYWSLVESWCQEEAQPKLALDIRDWCRRGVQSPHNLHSEKKIVQKTLLTNILWDTSYKCKVQHCVMWIYACDKFAMSVWYCHRYRFAIVSPWTTKTSLPSHSTCQKCLAWSLYFIGYQKECEAHIALSEPLPCDIKAVIKQMDRSWS